MTVAIALPLFYDIATSRFALQSLVQGAAQAPTIDTIDFDAEAGGDADRQFALPFLPGMDAVELDAASLTFRVGQKQVEIGPTLYSVSQSPDGKGVVLTLKALARLTQVDLTYAPPVVPAGQTLRVIVRPAQGGGFGPPILAAPDFDPPGPTFGRTLTGLGITDAPGQRHVLTVPGLLGTTWLMQLATGKTPVDLAPLPIVPTIGRVTIQAAPRNLSIVLSGDTPVPLWGNKDTLLPESGEQNVSFLPLAQKRLVDALTKADPAAVTLPLSLRFHSDTAARLEVTSRALTGRYTVRPLDVTPATPAKPITIHLYGGFTPLVFRAPPALRPASSTASLTARLLGRALNAGSPPAPLTIPGHGLRVTTDRTVAARLPIAARQGADAPGTPVQIASLRLRLATTEAAEAVLDLRHDAAGKPGAIAAPSVVHQFAAGFNDWQEFALAAPLTVAAGQTLWAALRLTKGTLLWHVGQERAGQGGAGEIGIACVSADKGASWGDATAALQDPATLLLQAFHVQDPPYPQPLIQLWNGPSLLFVDWFAGGKRSSDKEFIGAEAPLPSQALDLLALATAPAGALRAQTTLLAYSDTVLDLVVTGMTIAYDPYTARGTG